MLVQGIYSRSSTTVLPCSTTGNLPGQSFTRLDLSLNHHSSIDLHELHFLYNKFPSWISFQFQTFRDTIFLSHTFIFTEQKKSEKLMHTNLTYNSELNTYIHPPHSYLLTLTNPSCPSYNYYKPELVLQFRY